MPEEFRKRSFAVCFAAIRTVAAKNIPIRSGRPASETSWSRRSLFTDF
jgi:hypothetical protein